MKEIKKHQIKYIHTLKHKASLTDEYYRLLLNSKFNKNSCKDLTEAQASVLITLLTRQVQGANSVSYTHLTLPTNSLV